MEIGNSGNLALPIIEQMGRSIVRGESPTTLPTEQELCVRFSVSRTSVREVMKALSTKGLIDSRPRRGARIRDREKWNPLDLDILNWTEKNEFFFQDLIELRRIVEIPAAEMAAVRAKLENIAAMEQALSDMMNAELQRNPSQFIEADMRLHREVGRACHNELILQLFRIISPFINISFNATIHLLGIVQTFQLHKTLVEEIRSRNPERAGVAMRAIIDDSWADLQTSPTRAAGASREST